MDLISVDRGYGFMEIIKEIVGIRENFELIE